MRFWFLALLSLVAWLPLAAQAGICAQTISIPSDSPLLIEYERSRTVMGHDPWVIRLRHPNDPRIVVDLGLVDRKSAKKLDRPYMLRLERASMSATRDLYKRSGLKVLSADLQTVPRTSWQVRALGDGMVQEYRSDRIGDDCALLASVRMPDAYARSSVPGRINAMVDSTAQKLIAIHGAPAPRPDRDLPSGLKALLTGLGLPLLAFGLLRLAAWRANTLGEVPIGILFRIGCVMPLLLGWGAVMWSLLGTMYGRGSLDNIELLLLGISNLVLALAWLGSRRQHIAALGALLGPQLVLHAIYWIRGWHWEPQHFWWVLAATLTSGLICAIGAYRTRQEIRAQKVIDQRILEMLARGAD